MEIPPFHDARLDLIRCKVTPTNADGFSAGEPKVIEMALLGGSLRATAHQAWLEAGRPEHAVIDVELVRGLGQFDVTKGSLSEP